MIPSFEVGDGSVAVTIGNAPGPAGSSGVVTVSAPLTNSGTSSASILGLSIGSGLSIVGGALTAAAGGYTLPPASSTVLGGVKQGANVTIDGTGVLSVAAPVTWSTLTGKPTFATVATSGAYADLSGTPASYTLPTASSSILGGIKIGSGLTIDGFGVVTAAGTYTLPAATTSVLGGVIVGTGLAVTSGTISAAVVSVAGKTGAVTLVKADVGLSAVDNVADASKPVSTAQANADAVVQAYAVQRSNHTGTQAVGTITGLGSLATQSGTFSGTSSGTNTGDQTITLTGDVTGSGTGSFVATLAASGVTAGTYTSVTVDAKGRVTAGTNPAAYSLPTASSTVLGGIKIGSGLSIDGSGVVTASGGSTANVVTTPTTLSADTNNWSIGTGDIFRISASAAVNVTGIAAGTSGQTALLVNVGSFAITLKHASTGSSSANRFTVPWAGDCVIPAKGSVVIYYDGTLATWMIV